MRGRGDDSLNIDCSSGENNNPPEEREREREIRCVCVSACIERKHCNIRQSFVYMYIFILHIKDTNIHTQTQ